METADRARVDRERAFHDDRFSDDSSRQPVGKFYRAVPSAKEDYCATVVDRARGRVLEYGCGTGSLAFDLASQADVVGIDISPVAIEAARVEAAHRGVTAEFVEMNAESLDFPSGSFDLVCGSGILHHLDIETAARQLAKVVKSGGSAVFLEPMGYNPAINWYRDRTPGMRSADEHPLVRHDLRVLASSARELQTRFHGLAALAAAPFLDRSFGGSLSAALQRLDRSILRLPLVSELAWIVVIELEF